MATRSAGVRGVARLLITSMERRSDTRGVRRGFRGAAAGDHARTACDAAEAPACAPCRAPAPPACRSPARAALRGQRVSCRPPPHPARPPCGAPPPPCPLTCERHTQNTLNGYVKEAECTEGPRGRCGDSMDRVAQRISAARLIRRREYEREVAARAAEPPAAPTAPATCRLAAGREVVRATDGRDYVVLPPLPSSQPKCEHDVRTSTVELDPAKGCVINRSSHVDPCAHRPRLLLEIDRSEASKTSRSTPPLRKTSLDSTPSSAQYRDNDSGVENLKQCCKGSALGPLTDWCSSRPKIESQRPDCVPPSLVERIKQRPNNCTKEIRKFHTFSFLSQNITPTERNEIGDITAKVKADADKLNKMLYDRENLKDAGRGRNTTLEQTEEASASGQLELRSPASGAGVRVHVALLGGATPASRCARPTCNKGPPSDGTPQDPRSTYYGKCDSWLSIKNIQKKFTGCRKDSPPITNVGDSKSESSNTPSKEANLGGTSSLGARKTTPKLSPCEQRRQQPSDSPCHTKQKQKPKPPPCGGAPPTARFSAQCLPLTSII